MVLTPTSLFGGVSGRLLFFGVRELRRTALGGVGVSIGEILSRICPEVDVPIGACALPGVLAWGSLVPKMSEQRSRGTLHKLRLPALFSRLLVTPGANQPTALVWPRVVQSRFLGLWYKRLATPEARHAGSAFPLSGCLGAYRAPAVRGKTPHGPPPPRSDYYRL